MAKPHRARTGSFLCSIVMKFHMITLSQNKSNLNLCFSNSYVSQQIFDELLLPGNCAGVGNTAAMEINEILMKLAPYIVDFMYFFHVYLFVLRERENVSGG